MPSSLQCWGIALAQLSFGVVGIGMMLTYGDHGVLTEQGANGPYETNPQALAHAMTAWMNDAVYSSPKAQVAYVSCLTPYCSYN